MVEHDEKIKADLDEYIAMKTKVPPTGGGGKPTPVPAKPTPAKTDPAETPPPEKKKSNLIKIEDTRTINPGNGQPYKSSAKGSRTTNADPAVIKAIVAHAKAQGVDPYTALAIAYQESEFGNITKGKDWGQAWTYNASKGIPETDTLNYEASKLVNALRDKLAYAKKLGYDKKGEDFALQAYNGYGDLRSNLVKQWNPATKKMDYVPATVYGNKITGDTPFLTSQHPVYGKSVISLRDELLKNQKAIQELVDTTDAYSSK